MNLVLEKLKLLQRLQAAFKEDREDMYIDLEDIACFPDDARLTFSVREFSDSYKVIGRFSYPFDADNASYMMINKQNTLNALYSNWLNFPLSIDICTDDSEVGIFCMYLYQQSVPEDCILKTMWKFILFFYTVHCIENYM